MRTFLLAFFFWVGVALMIGGAKEIADLWGGEAAYAKVEHHKADRLVDKVHTFNGQLALSPGMFDGAMQQDRIKEMDRPADLKGGALTDGPSANAVVFRSSDSASH